MNKLWGVAGSVVLFLTGCVAYEPATLLDGEIANPGVGWQGYTVQVPSGVTTIKTSADTEGLGRASKIRAWYEEQSARYTTGYYTSFSEQFLFEPPNESFFLSFVTEAYDLRTGWGVLSSVEKQYMIQKMINRKMVVINDMQANFEQIEINGQRGWYISGISRPYLKKNSQILAYEGICLLGNLKELYWFEAFGAIEVRETMKNKVDEMANSLVVQ